MSRHIPKGPRPEVLTEMASLAFHRAPLLAESSRQSQVRRHPCIFKMWVWFSVSREGEGKPVLADLLSPPRKPSERQPLPSGPQVSENWGFRGPQRAG